MNSANTIQYYKFNTEVHGQFVGRALIGTYILIHRKVSCYKLKSLRELTLCEWEKYVHQASNKSKGLTCTLERIILNVQESGHELHLQYS